MHERAEAEATKQRELQERQASEHKARVKERLKKQEAKIRRAAEERLRREKAYQDLLSKTRECDANRFLRHANTVYSNSSCFRSSTASQTIAISAIPLDYCTSVASPIATFRICFLFSRFACAIRAH